MHKNIALIQPLLRCIIDNNAWPCLNNGALHFKGSPGELIKQVRGHVWQINTSGLEYEMLKEKYAVTSTIPTMEGWEVQIVGDKIDLPNAIEIEPNLEHAYVYYMEYSGYQFLGAAYWFGS